MKKLILTLLTLSSIFSSKVEAKRYVLRQVRPVVIKQVVRPVFIRNILARAIIRDPRRLILVRKLVRRQPRFDLRVTI